MYLARVHVSKAGLGYDTPLHTMIRGLLLTAAKADRTTTATAAAGTAKGYIRRIKDLYDGYNY